MPWAGLVIAFAIAAPNLVWQVQHDFPTVEFLREMSQGVLADIPRALFLAGQVLYMHPFTLPVGFAGLWFLLSGSDETCRALGIAFLAVIGVLLLTHGKPYYAAPAYPPLFAAGAVRIEHWLEARSRRARAAAAPPSSRPCSRWAASFFRLPRCPSCR
jgi:hypothetical protein